MPAGNSLNVEQDVRGALIQDAHERFVHCEFKDIPIVRASAVAQGEPTGTAGDVNTVVVGPSVFQYHSIVGQTILCPTKTTLGLNISQDLVDNDGLEYTLGNEFPADTLISNVAGATKGTFTVGTDAPFYFSLKLYITDVSGTDDCLMGFRKAEAYNATVDDYDEMAAFNIISGDIKIETILNNAATVTTDTTDNWTDATAKTLTVLVDSDGSITNDGTVGKCYFFIDGLRPSAEATTRMKFDSGEIVIPFFHMLHAADVAEATTFQIWESGFYPMGQSSQLQFPTTLG